MTDTKAPMKSRGNSLGSSSFVSQLLNRMQLAMRAGLTFGGTRDLYTTFGYNRSPQHVDFLAKYLRQDVAKRIIDKPVNATWSDAPKVIGKGKGFEAAWEELVVTHNLFQMLAKVDQFAGLGMFAILVVGFDDYKKLSEPVNTGRANKITYLQPYLEGTVAIEEYETDETSPRFGLPKLYTVTPGKVEATGVNGLQRVKLPNNFQVHWTRVLHVADNAFENMVFGHSRLEHIYNVLDDLLKVVGGSAETYWLTGNRGLHADVDKETELDEDDEENLTAEIEEYQHQLRRFVRTRGVTLKDLGSEVADPKGVFDVLMSILSSATGIPKRVLMGAEAGQLASQQDRANWAIVIDERIRMFAEPVILKPFITMLQNSGVLPQGKVTFDWPDAYKMSPLERAQTAAQMARSAANVTKALANARNDVEEAVISIEEAREIISFGKHMPVLSGLPEGKVPKPPKPEPEPEQQAFGTPTPTPTPTAKAPNGTKNSGNQ